MSKISVRTIADKYSGWGLDPWTRLSVQVHQGVYVASHEQALHLKSKIKFRGTINLVPDENSHGLSIHRRILRKENDQFPTILLLRTSKRPVIRKTFIVAGVGCRSVLASGQRVRPVKYSGRQQLYDNQFLDCIISYPRHFLPLRWGMRVMQGGEDEAQG